MSKYHKRYSVCLYSIHRVLLICIGKKSWRTMYSVLRIYISKAGTNGNAQKEPWAWFAEFVLFISDFTYPQNLCGNLIILKNVQRKSAWFCFLISFRRVHFCDFIFFKYKSMPEIRFFHRECERMMCLNFNINTSTASSRIHTYFI